MLILSSTPPKPEVITLSGGPATAVVMVADSITYDAARFEADRLMEAIREGAMALDEAGMGDRAIDIDDDAAMVGLSTFLFAVELLSRCILDWSGVGDEDGNPIVVSKAAVLALVRNPVDRQRLMMTALRSFHRVADEGNASAVSPRGEGEAAEATATDVGSSERPAPSVDAA